MMFVLGFKGNEWAWRNKEWQSVEQFHSVQRKWATWSIGLWLLLLAICIIIPVGILGWGISTEMPEIRSMLNDFSPHRRYCNYALSMAEHDPRYRGYLGGRLEPRGPAEFKLNENGYGELALPVRGPRGEGTLYLRTRQRGSQAELEHAELELKNLQRIRIDTAYTREKMHSVEQRIVNIITARRNHREWEQRDPRGKEEAEELYQSIMQRIITDGRVKELLGETISARLQKAKINLEGSTGDAEFNIELSGAQQKASGRMRLLRTLGQWRFAGAEINDNGRVIDFPAEH